MRDGTVEPVSRDQILRHEWDRERFCFPVQLTTSRIGNVTRLIYSAVRYDHNTYIKGALRNATLFGMFSGPCPIKLPGRCINRAT